MGKLWLPVTAASWSQLGCFALPYNGLSVPTLSKIKICLVYAFSCGAGMSPHEEVFFPSLLPPGSELLQLYLQHYQLNTSNAGS